MIRILSSALLFVALSTAILHAQSHQTHLKVGDQAPAVIGQNQNGREVNVPDLLEDGPVVLFFYRGEWCPVCKRHLSNFQDSLSFIMDKGASVIAITPEQPESMEKMAKATKVTFELINDHDYAIMKSYGVDFKVTQENVPKYFDFTLTHTREANGNEDDVLPVPATFIIGQDGTIQWLHYDFDYHNRASVKDIIDHL